MLVSPLAACFVGVRAIPVRAPRPHISNHVVEAVGVGFVRIHGSLEEVAVECLGIVGKIPLPKIRMEEFF